MPLSRLKGRWPTVELALLRLAHAAVLRRLAIEAGWARLMVQVTGRASAPRVVTAACWRFPIYSQTFVQQEAAAMAHAGFALRMFHAETGPRAELAHPCAVLWGLRRRLVLHRSTGADDLAHYRASMPQRVTHLLQRLADAAGLGVDELLRHEHLLQAFSFARAVEAWHADYLHSYFFYEQSLFVWVAANLLDLPRGVSCYADHLLDDYPLKLVALHLATAAVVVATSRRIGAELAMLHGGPLATVLVKPNAVDCASFAARSDIAVAAPGMLRLVCVCRLDPKKGLEYLIDALRLLQLQGTSMELNCSAPRSSWHRLSNSPMATRTAFPPRCSRRWRQAARSSPPMPGRSPRSSTMVARPLSCRSATRRRWAWPWRVWPPNRRWCAAWAWPRHGARVHSLTWSTASAPSTPPCGRRCRRLPGAAPACAQPRPDREDRPAVLRVPA
jgi:hypothetical protein